MCVCVHVSVYSCMCMGMDSCGCVYVFLYVFVYVFMYVCTLEELKLQGINIRDVVLPRYSRAKCLASDLSIFCTADQVSV